MCTCNFQGKHTGYVYLHSPTSQNYVHEGALLVLLYSTSLFLTGNMTHKWYHIVIYVSVQTKMVSVRGNFNCTQINGRPTDKCGWRADKRNLNPIQ